jgi:DNA modification methylase
MNIQYFRYECENALDFAKSLDDGSMSLVMTSPPYNIGKEYETRKGIGEYLDSMMPLIKELCRVLADSGSLCWQSGTFVDRGEVFPLDIFFYQIFKDAGLKLRNRIIWHFGHGLHCRHRFSGRYETILWFSKGDDYTFNLDDVRIPPKCPGKKHFRGPKKGQLSCNPKGKNPEDVWEATIERLIDDWDSCLWDVPNVKSNHPEKEMHPCQYPVELAERCVLALTNEGDAVYDPFAGVGSTLIAALKNGRQAYGSDLEQKYVDIGLERIERLRNGKLKTRPIWKNIVEPSGTASIVLETDSSPVESNEQADGVFAFC